jgi:hypothetical protein
MNICQWQRCLRGQGLRSSRNCLSTRSHFILLRTPFRRLVELVYPPPRHRLHFGIGSTSLDLVGSPLNLVRFQHCFRKADCLHPIDCLRLQQSLFQLLNCFLPTSIAVVRDVAAWLFPRLACLIWHLKPSQSRCCDKLNRLHLLGTSCSSLKPPKASFHSKST